MDLHLNGTFLSGKNILKVKRDYRDPYLWVLAENNEVYRINSLTRDVVDYTNKFSAYNSYHFIDIAGVSKDTVFIATNSSDLLMFNNGQFETLGVPQGISGAINSIGLNGIYKRENPDFLGWTHIIIATTDGIFYYNYVSKKLTNANYFGYAKLFDITYRNSIFDSPNTLFPTDTVNQIGIETLGNYTIYQTVFYLNNTTFGNTFRSAFTTYPNAHDFSSGGHFPDLGDVFWATEKGLFQINWNPQRYQNYGFNKYLSGQNISKITSIFGMVNFGEVNLTNSPFVKENMLVGTANGLYFSNSKYQYYDNQLYNFFYCNELGSKSVNDICTDADSYNHLVHNDYWQVEYPNVCENGIWVATTTGLYLLKPDYMGFIKPTDKISAAWFDQNIGLDELKTCAGNTVKVKLYGVQDQNLALQWYKDGQPIVGESLNEITVSAQGEYNAVLYDACSGVRLETNHLKLTYITAPVFNFSYPKEMNFCSGATTSLQTDDNPDYKYRWRKNNILTGDETSALNTTEAGKYKLEVSSCSGTWVPSKEVEINFINVPQPDIKANKAAYCVGEPATLSTSFVNDGTYTISWFRDGNLLNSEQNKTSITTTQAGSYVVKLNSNLVACDNTSAALPVSFEATPTLSLERIITTTLCDGQSVDLKATYSGGTVKWSTGASTDMITVSQSGLYGATVKTAAGCEVAENIAVQFFNNPILNIPNATLCQFTNESVTLTAPEGFAKYEWNQTVGNASFTTNKLGVVTLKVTDNNGCTATQTVTIASHCDDIHIPNTFTPNGDGINDTWKIEGLQGDASITVNVFNRLGMLIYQSIGYNTPWDGTFNGKKVPSGTYYYILSAKKGGQILTGSLAIVN